MTIMKDNIIKWFLTGRVGLSSQAMVGAVLEIPANDDHPHDPDDLNRCLKLLAFAPGVRKHFDKIAKLSDTWRRLINRWDEIEAKFLEEAGFDWSKARKAPNTYEMMRQVIEYPEGDLG